MTLAREPKQMLYGTIWWTLWSPPKLSWQLSGTSWGPSGAKTQSETKKLILYCVLSAKMKRATISLQSGEGDIDFDW